jgi:hypothetical protein
VASGKVLDQPDVALRLIHLHVEYPTAVGRGGEVWAAPIKLLEWQFSVTQAREKLSRHYKNVRSKN